MTVLIVRENWNIELIVISFVLFSLLQPTETSPQEAPTTAPTTARYTSQIRNEDTRRVNLFLIYGILSALVFL